MTTTEVPVREWVKRGYIERAVGLAIHEASHALVAEFAGLCVTRVSIVEPTLEGGVAVIEHSEPYRFAHLLFCVAGTVGEHGRIAWPPIKEAGGDEEAAALLVERLGIDRQQFEDAHKICEEVLRMPAKERARKAIVARLCEDGEVSGDELRAIVNAAAASAPPEEADAA